MLLKIRHTSSASLSAVAWKKFRKDIPAMLSLGYIACVSFIAIFAYFLAPDHTPDADRQSLEISMLQPGTRVEFIRIPKPEPGKNAGIFQRFWNGTPDKATFLPVQDTKVNGDTIVYKAAIPGGGSSQEIYRLPVSSMNRENASVIHRTFWLGTDRFGRDVLSRLLIGARISLAVGIIAVLISLSVGIFLGAIAGYYRGKTDAVISWLINVVWSIPTLLLVIAITVAIGKGLVPVFIAVGLTMWVDVARIVRGQFFGLREKEFVEAGKALGYLDSRIIFRHILPNATGAILVITASNFASAILIESGLSFLGFGAQPPVPTWGSMIEANRSYIITGKAHLAFAPGIAIMLLVLAFTLAGNGLRNALDEKS